MRISSKSIDYISVFLIWAAYSRLIIYVWAYYVVNHPILDWALATLIPDYRALFYILIYTHDTLINILLALPSGYLLRKYSHKNLWGPVIVSVSLVFLWDYRQVFLREGGVLEFFSSFGALYGVVVAIGLLPLAYCLAGKWNRVGGTK